MSVKRKFSAELTARLGKIPGASEIVEEEEAARN